MVFKFNLKATYVFQQKIRSFLWFKARIFRLNPGESCFFISRSFCLDIFQVCAPIVTHTRVKHRKKTSNSRRCNVRLKNVNKWTVENKLSLNLSKTFDMTFGCKNLPDLLLSLKISNALISYCTVGKFMGLTIDSKLQFANHIHYTCNTVSISIGNISKLKSLLPLACLKRLDYSTVCS